MWAALFASANKYEIRRLSPQTRTNIMGVCFGKMITVKIENLGLAARQEIIENTQ